MVNTQNLDLDGKFTEIHISRKVTPTFRGNRNPVYQSDKQSF